MATDNRQHNTTAGPTPLMETTSIADAHRRTLLKGAGKGVVVLAASMPLKTLASNSVFTYKGVNGAPIIRCGISGMQSGVHSRDTITTQCSGYSPGWYRQSVTVNNKLVPKNWPALPNPWTYNTPCKNVFSKCVLLFNSQPATLWDVMRDPSFSSTDEFHWIAAWLNGISRVFNFPYTGQEVLDLYNGRGVGGVPYTPEAALNFFKTYMELK